MNTAFFFETQQISNNSILFDEFKTQKISFSYFQVNRTYYLFVYSQKSKKSDSSYFGNLRSKDSNSSKASRFSSTKSH